MDGFRAKKESEERTTGRQNNVIRALRLGIRSMRRHPGLALIFLTAALSQGALQGLLIWALRKALLAFNSAGGVSAGVLALSAVAIFSIWLILSFTAYLAELVSIRLGQRVEIESMLTVLTRLLKLSIRFFDKNGQANFVMSSYYDLKGIRNVTLEIGKIFLFLTRLAGLVAAAWLMSPKLALIGLVTVPLGALPAHWLGQRITQAAKKEREALTTLYDSFFQVSSGIRVVKANRGEIRVLNQARQIGLDLYYHIMKQAKTKGLSRLLLEGVSGVGLILVLTIGGRDVAAGILDWQSLLGLLVAVMAVYAPIVGLLQSYTSIRSVIPNLDRVDTIMNEPIEIRDHPNPQRLFDAPRVIELRNVAFGYGTQMILQSISATFYHGETIGIVGPSGAGKTTLISLLLRFYDPIEGTILFDGIDLRKIRHSDLMDMSAIVMQEPFLFVDTVANNIRIGRPEASLDEVIAAAKAANVHDEIMLMDRGYDTILGRRHDARGVSGGQKQRICIAAALLKNAPILFLDEATSSLDSVSEQKVQLAIDRLMEGRTTFVIAHRLSTLRNVDRTVVLDKGQLVGFGTHDALLIDCPSYRELWSYQDGSVAARFLR